MKRTFLALVLMLCSLVIIPNDRSLAYNAKVNPSKAVNNIKVSKYVVAVPSACYSHTLSANQGFSTTYQWTDCHGVVQTQHLERGSTIIVCAQEGTVSGGPWTKNGPC